MAPKRLSLRQIKLLNQHRYILKKLESSTNKDRKTILKNAPAELFKVLNLVFRMLHKKQLDLSEQQNKQVNKHKRLIRTASGLKGSKMQQKLVKQRGGALSTILSVAIPIISGLIQSLL